MEKCNLKHKTMIESQLQKIYSYPENPRDSKIDLDKSYVNIDNRSQGGSHWTWFWIKDNKSYYFESFRGQTDKLLLIQIPKPRKYHTYKIQDINS